MPNFPVKHTRLPQHPAVLLALGLFAAPAMATEEPKFETLSRHGHIELRRYAPFIVAETWVERGRHGCGFRQGFRAIADYIWQQRVGRLGQPAQRRKNCDDCPRDDGAGGAHRADERGQRRLPENCSHDGPAGRSRCQLPPGKTARGHRPCKGPPVGGCIL